MKKTLLFSAIMATMGVWAQDLPSNPKPGSCYVRCITPDVFKNEQITVQTSPAYTVLKANSAQYKTVEEKVLMAEEYKQLEVVPATFTYEDRTYVKKEASSTISIQKAEFGTSSQTIEIAPKYAKWELGEKVPDCDSPDPNDCRAWCYKPYPAQYQEVQQTTLTKDASFTRNPISAENGTYKVKVVKNPASVREVMVPAKYQTIKKQVLVKDAYTTETKVDPKNTTVTKEVMDKKGGLTSWKEVDCKLTEYNLLPINYDLNSARLLPESKRKIDELLLPILRDNAGTSVEIASHTDARGSKESNKDLSERRAQSVVNYLVSKGINASRLVPNGYGENRLKNRCADGVSCTEREHRENRRTEFRIINAGK